jgi:hypothetical protein
MENYGEGGSCGGGVREGEERRGEGRENTLGHQLQGALFSLRQGQQSFMCQHIGRRSSNVSFERKDWRSIRLLSTELGLVAKAGVIAGLWIGVVQGLGV